MAATMISGRKRRELIPIPRSSATIATRIMSPRVVLESFMNWTQRTTTSWGRCGPMAGTLRLVSDPVVGTPATNHLF